MATASLVQFLYAGVKDTLGNPVASGTASFYVPGSTSETITIYKDRAQAETLAQPVTLDAAGAAEVYVAAQCEIVIKDSLGVQKRLTANGASVEDAQVNVTWNSTREPLSTAFTALETSLGPGASYAESGSTGVVARTYHDAVHTYISPFDFGAVGDGSADDTIPVQRALNRAIATGLPLFLSAVHKTTTTITGTGSVEIVGTGSGIAKLVPTSASFTGLTLTGATLRLSGFSVLEPKGIYTSSALLLQATTAAMVNDVAVTGYFGFNATLCALAMFTNCTATLCSTSFYVADSKSGCIGCTSTTASTDISAVTGYPIDIGNSWTPTGTSGHDLGGGEYSYGGTGSVVAARVAGVPFQSDLTISLTLSIPAGTTTAQAITITFAAGLIPNAVLSVVASNGYITAKNTRQAIIAPPATTGGDPTTVFVIITAY